MNKKSRMVHRAYRSSIGILITTVMVAACSTQIHNQHSNHEAMSKGAHAQHADHTSHDTKAHTDHKQHAEQSSHRTDMDHDGMGAADHMAHMNMIKHDPLQTFIERPGFDVSARIIMLHHCTIIRHPLQPTPHDLLTTPGRSSP